MEKIEVQKICYFQDLYNVDTQEQVAVNMCGFDGVRRGIYFRGEPIRRMEVEVKAGKLKNGKIVGKDDVMEKMIKG